MNTAMCKVAGSSENVCKRFPGTSSRPQQPGLVETPWTRTDLRLRVADTQTGNGSTTAAISKVSEMTTVVSNRLVVSYTMILIHLSALVMWRNLLWQRCANRCHSELYCTVLLLYALHNRNNVSNYDSLKGGDFYRIELNSVCAGPTTRLDLFPSTPSIHHSRTNRVQNRSK